MAHNNDWNEVQRRILNGQYERLERERERELYQREVYRTEDRLIERVIQMFRGRRISQRAFDIIVRELKYCVEPALNDYNIEWKRRELEKLVIEYQSTKMRNEWKPLKFPFRLDEEDKEFIEESDMKL